MVAGSAELSTCGVERSLRGTKGFLSLIVLSLGGKPPGKKCLLPLIGRGRVAEHGLASLYGGVGSGHCRLLLLRDKPGEHLIGGDMVADIDQALADAASH